MSDQRVTYERLMAYAAGELEPGESAAVEAWLDRHPDAARTVARYRIARQALLTDEGVDPPPETVARARAIFRPATAASGPRLGEIVAELVARLVYDSRAEPALAGLRGPAVGFQTTYELSGDVGELDLQAEPAGGDGEGRWWRLIGQIAAPQPPSGLQVELCRAGSLSALQSVEGDDRGGFVLRVEPGTYDLRLHLPQGTAVVRDIRVV